MIYNTFRPFFIHSLAHGTKREIVRLIVKLIGVYFIYEAAISVWSLIGTIFAMVSLSSNVHIGFAERSNLLGIMAWALAMAFFYGLTGWYLIKDGKLLFVVLNREEPPLSLKNFRQD